MKNIRNQIMILIAVSAIFISFTSCNYNEIADAEYPNQMIYMPAASSGVYNIDAFNPDSGTYRYKLDLEGNKLIIPLSVYRSGINNKGVIEVAIMINNDTINQLISAEQLNNITGAQLQLLPSTAFTLDSFVTLNDGEESKGFALTIDLGYIRTQPNKRLAIGIDVKSAQVATSTKLKTAIVEINTNFLVPAPVAND